MDMNVWHRNKMDLDHVPWICYIQLHRFILSQRGDLVKIHLVALASTGITTHFFLASIQATTLNCSHTYCKHCIVRWLHNHNDCPQCRGKVTTQTRSLVLDNYIEQAVKALGEEAKKKREQIVKERKGNVWKSLIQYCESGTFMLLFLQFCCALSNLPKNRNVQCDRPPQMGRKS